MKKIVFGIGIVLAALAVFAVSTVPAANAAIAYFEPQHSSADPGDYKYAYLYVDIVAGEHLAGGQMQIQFDRTHANITKCLKGCGPAAEGKHCWAALDMNFDYTDNGYFWGGVSGPQVAVWNEDDEYWYWDEAPGGYFEGPMHVRICKYKVYAEGTPGVSPFNFGFEMFPEGCYLCQPSEFGDETGTPFANMTWVNGTFTHLGSEETYTATLEPGWNLISLPLTPSNHSTTAVLVILSGGLLSGLEIERCFAQVQERTRRHDGTLRSLSRERHQCNRTDMDV